MEHKTPIIYCLPVSTCHWHHLKQQYLLHSICFPVAYTHSRSSLLSNTHMHSAVCIQHPLQPLIQSYIRLVVAPLP